MLLNIAIAAFIGLVAVVLLRVGAKLLSGRARAGQAADAPAPVRDVSTVASEGAAELRHEIIEIGGPLKPHHRRLVQRDERLLPKSGLDQVAQVWPRPAKKRFFSKDEAARLFSPTMRTRNRNIRDLAPDEDQLRRYHLPLWRSEDDVAAALGLSPKQLRHFSAHRLRETHAHYLTFAIPKRDGRQRLIHAPKRRLKAVLRNLNAELVSRLPVSPFAHGFIKGRSIASNAAPHVGKRVVIKFDIKDCFPSLHFGRVRGLLIALGYSFPVAASLAVLMTEPPRQAVTAEGKRYLVPVGPRTCVQGAPTSPGLCNAILLRLDRRLAGLAAKHGFSFTRYADDLTFSGDDAAKVTTLLQSVAKIVAAEGFQLNTAKTHVMRKGNRQMVAGVVVNETAGLSRTERRKLRAAIHQLGANPPAEAVSVRRQLAGKVAYLHMLNPKQAEPLARQLAAAPRG